MFKYETHLHTTPVSKCANATVEETVDFYKSIGYDGIFITNHFLDGNINIDRNTPYEEKINFYFSDYEKAYEYGKSIGFKVFPGVEITYGGSDFLIYGLDKEWYLSHPEIMQMPKSEELQFMMDSGALVVHAHPFREARYIDHIRLFPRKVHAVEIINANRTPFENEMARHYAEAYGLKIAAGTDNHCASRTKVLGGVETETPINTVNDYKEKVLNGEVKLFFETRE